MVEEVNSDVVAKISVHLALDIHINLADIVHCLDFFLSTQASSLTGQTVYTSGA